MKKFASIATFLSLLAAVTYAGVKWAYVVTANGNDGYYYMAPTQTLGKQIKRAWIKEESLVSPALQGPLIHLAIQPFTESDEESPYTYTHEDSATLAHTTMRTLFLAEFDYQSDRYRILEWWDYYFDGHKARNDMDTAWHYPAPATIMDTLMNFAANR